jgi:anti-sigma B factor antagonist
MSHIPSACNASVCLTKAIQAGKVSPVEQPFEVRPDETAPGRFRLIGELDLSAVDALLKAMDGENGPGRNVVLDLSELTFVDSCGISAFVRLAHDRSDGAVLVLDRPRPEVKRVFELVGLSAAHNIEVRTS